MYVVLEMQTNKENQTALLTSTHSTFAEAQSKYYLVLSAAAVSPVYKHSALLCDDEGTSLMSQGFVKETTESEA